MSTWWEYVRDGMERTGMTKADLARATGIHPSTVSNWDNKQARAESDAAIKVAAAFSDSNPLDALIAAGHVPPEARNTPVAAELGSVSAVDLLAELRRRMRDAP